MGQLRKSLRPAMVKNSIEWSTDAEQAPIHIPSIFNRSRLIVYAFSKGNDNNLFLFLKDPNSLL